MPLHSPSFKPSPSTEPPSGASAMKPVLNEPPLKQDTLVLAQARLLRLTTMLTNHHSDFTSKPDTPFDIIQECLEKEKKRAHVKQLAILSRSKLLLRFAIWWYCLTPLWWALIIRYQENGNIYFDSPAFGPLLGTTIVVGFSMGVAVLFTVIITTFLESDHGLLVHGAIWELQKKLDDRYWN